MATLLFPVASLVHLRTLESRKLPDIFARLLILVNSLTYVCLMRVSSRFRDLLALGPFTELLLRS